MLKTPNFKKNKIEEKKRKDLNISISNSGWYRVAEAKTGKAPTACIIKIGTRYSTTHPFVAIFNILTLMTRCEFSELKKLFYSSTKVIDKIRVQVDETAYNFYLDIHYTVDTANTINVDIIAPDEYWRLTDNTSIVDYKTITELTL